MKACHKKISKVILTEAFKLSIENDVINLQQNEVNFQKYEECSKLRKVFFGYASIEPFGMEKVFVNASIALLAIVKFSH